MIDIHKLMDRFKTPEGILGKIALGVIVLVGVALMYPRGESLDFDYRVGSVWAQKDLIAPFSFPIFRDEQEYGKDVEAARAGVYQVFERDTALATHQLKRLNDFFRTLMEASHLHQQLHKPGKRSAAQVAEDSLLFVHLASSLDIVLNEEQWSLVDHLISRNEVLPLKDLLVAELQHAYDTGILDRKKTSVSPPEIAIRQGKLEVITPISHVTDPADVAATLENRLTKQYGEGSPAMSLAYRIGLAYVAPNLRFGLQDTEASIAAAVDAVPRTHGIVQENERIVSKHERITPEIRLKLESFRRAKAERGPATDSFGHSLGSSLHVTILVVLYVIYLALFRKKIWGNNRRLALIALLILMEAFFAYLSRELDVTTPVEYLIVVPTASMLLTIIFDSRVGFYGTVIIALLVAGIRGSDYSIALASLVAGVLSVYSVRDMKNRTQLFRSLGFIFSGYAVTILSLGLERYEAVSVMAEQLAFALINAVISPVLTYGLLIFLEKAFRVTTDLTLLELAHYNHPLLRMLSEKAPGTYHHSMTMASLAEAAAAAIGANVALARVGAYFHDIGKVVKPNYFVENQKGSRNRHDKLAPRMSSLIIAAHVKEGMTLAREYGLPEEIIDFIPMHHGTTRMDYFYNKAVQLAQDSQDETKLDEINEQDYRYSGPRPQTKETGIMMLADAIEASVRTIEEPTPQRLADAIDELIKKRLEEGELDDCPLTLRDLTKIKAAFLGILVGIYHTRVKYPEPVKLRPRPPRAKPVEPERPTLESEDVPPAGDDIP